MSKVPLMVPVALMVAGCGTAGKQEPIVAQPPHPEQGEPRALRAENVELARKDDSQRLQWSVRGKSVLVTLAENGKAGGELTGVTGSIYEEGKVSANFRSDRAKAEQTNDQLELIGTVELVGVNDGAKLIASRVQWLAKRRLIHAQGSVKMVTKDYEIGPFPELYATPDLKKFGTPEHFNPPKR